jgi:hypothetical protein
LSEKHTAWVDAAAKRLDIKGAGARINGTGESSARQRRVNIKETLS